jgi:hypothetical protein
MRTSIVIPTYWQRNIGEKWQEGDAVYDHPTFLNGDETLSRTLESMKDLNNKDFNLILIVCPTADEIAEEAEKRVRKILDEAELEMDQYVFTVDTLERIKESLVKNTRLIEELDLLNIKGYSNVRNLCLYSAFLVGADVAILIDDDEIFENNMFVDMAKEHIGKRIYGDIVYGVAGYYLNKKDEYYDDVNMVPWMTYWDRFGSKTKAFDKIISCEPRLKRTPFAFGGAMVIHRNLFSVVPFDPNITRGEDIDYVINSKMFGFDFFLDNRLSIKHLPPKKHHPIWKRLREDIYRFLYDQAKIRTQYEVNNMRMITSKDFDPYPGDFLNDDLEDKIFKTNILLAMEYLAMGDVEGCRESIKNIYLSKFDAIPRKDVFTEYREIQRYWSYLIKESRGIRSKLYKIVEEYNHYREHDEFEAKLIMDKKHVKKALREYPEFSELENSEIEMLSNIAYVQTYKKDDFIFEKGQESKGLLILIKGEIKIVQFDENHEELLINVVKTNNIIGEATLINRYHSVNGAAKEPCEVIIVEREELEKLIVECPSFGNKLLRMMLSKLYNKLSDTNTIYKMNLQLSDGLEKQQ